VRSGDATGALQVGGTGPILPILQPHSPAPFQKWAFQSGRLAGDQIPCEQGNLQRIAVRRARSRAAPPRLSQCAQRVRDGTWPKFPRSHQGIQFGEQGGLTGDQGIAVPCRSERLGAPSDLLEQAALRIPVHRQGRPGQRA